MRKVENEMQSGWCPAVYLDVVFSSWVPHEHCVESGYLVDAHPGHTDHLGHMVHGRDRKPTVLTLKRVVGSDQLYYFSWFKQQRPAASKTGLGLWFMKLPNLLKLLNCTS